MVIYKKNDVMSITLIVFILPNVIYSMLAKWCLKRLNNMFPNSEHVYNTSDVVPYLTTPKKALNRVLEAVSIKEKGGLFHILRRAADSFWLQGIKINGKPRLKNGRQHFIRIEVVSEVLGHSSILITKKIYAQFDQESVIVGFM